MSWINRLALSAWRLVGCGSLVAVLCSCGENVTQEDTSTPFLVVLGIAQDAGFPQAQCRKKCCLAVWDYPEQHKKAACLGLIDLDLNKYWLFEATPDFKAQTRWIESQWEVELAGVFLTHAHVGHYTGLTQLGREITGASNMPVYAMPRMKQFLEENGPWDQLVELKNIKLVPLQADSTLQISEHAAITPFLVPHRDEYSETVGYKIVGENKKAIFIPDIDKWQKWVPDLGKEVTQVDLAFIDGSFYKNGELGGRDMSTIPHPLVVESMALLNDLELSDRKKVHFIHMNHTNPLLQEHSAAQDSVRVQGFQVAKEGAVFPI